MIYVLMGCWDMEIGGWCSSPCGGGISNRRQIGLTAESYAQCFRPLIGVIISNLDTVYKDFRKEHPKFPSPYRGYNF